jgi:hypothetical protein
MSDLFDPNGVITRWPRRAAEKVQVLDFLLGKFEHDRVYAEREVNAILNQHHSFGDWALLRRELYESQRMDRDAKTGTYWVQDRS